MRKTIGKWSDAEMYLTNHFNKGYSIKPKFKFYSKEMRTDVTLFTDDELKDLEGVYLCFLDRDKSTNEYFIDDNQLLYLYHLPFNNENRSPDTLKNDKGMYMIETFKLENVSIDDFVDTYTYTSPELIAKASMKAMQALIISQPKISPKFAAKQAVEYANELIKTLALL